MISSNIAKRSSIRRYQPDVAVTDAQISELLEAAMLAPSACNSRPWEFYAITNRDTLTAIADTHPYARMLCTAPLAIVVCAVPQQGNPEGYFAQDCGAATQNILLQAAELGLGTCWCGVYPREERIAGLKKVIDFPEGLIPFNVIAVGVPDETPVRRGFFEKEKVHYIR